MNYRIRNSFVNNLRIDENDRTLLCLLRLTNPLVTIISFVILLRLGVLKR